MALWVTLPSFVDDQKVERRDFQPLLNNLEVLKNRAFDHTLDFSTAANQSTTSTTLVDITIPKYTLNLDTEGGDLLVFAAIEARHSVAAGRVKFALRVDNVFHTPIDTTSDEVLYTVSNFAFEIVVPSLIFVVRNLAAGPHELAMSFASGDAGTTTLRADARRMHMVAVELH